ncbi:hypothetical protein CBR_g28787 [Chara braunii]|uniref:NADH:ubiquinone oxidoreductase intermediate-associated protein 30 domain-containing protein n=1 Tax=Chara braunii TaxID=69332 RepID=A0A388LA18_CHABU|nr:hypothetical protein CBR_g28787 [Chara braunii]|eukprot:GBG79072.1 hypothetical protein CBR_g28787 [Chara braunii]
MAMALFVLRTAALTALLLLAASARPACARPARALRRQPEVTIKSITFMGNGCSFDDTDFIPSQDSVAFRFGGLAVTTDGSLADRRKTCQVSFELDVPDGWCSAVPKVTGRGFADVEAGSKIIYEFIYYLSGQPGTDSVRRIIKGPAKRIVEFRQHFSPIVRSQSNGAVNLNVKIVATAEGSKATNIGDSDDDKLRLEFVLEWKRC